MRIISKKKIRDYYIHHVQAALPFVDWYMKMSSINAVSLNKLKKVFNTVDYVYGYTIFNIGGNNYRLIAAIHYNMQCCYIRKIWTHAEYSKPYNQIRLQRGAL